MSTKLLSIYIVKSDIYCVDKVAFFFFSIYPNTVKRMDNDIDELKKQIEELKNKIQEKESQPDPSNHARAELNTEEKELYSWEAPVRVFVKWDRKKVTTSIMWFAIVALFLLILHEFILLLAIAVLGIVSLLLVIMPPNITTHKITNKGIKTYDKLYFWDDLKDFWIADKKGIYVMHVDTKMYYPAKLFFVIPTENVADVMKILSKFMKYFETRQTQSWISRYNDGLYLSYSKASTFNPSNPVS